MRIVAGTARGRRLVVPDGRTTRPTTDRVREATFNALFSLDVIDDAGFVDLFAGSGAMGLEALSRGAAHCTFVERDRNALVALRDNISTLGFEAQSTVVPADAMAWLDRSPRVDVLVADPPYDFEDWPLVLERANAELLVIESDSPVINAVEGAPAWQVLRERTYGSTVVTIVSATEPSMNPAEESAT